VATFFVAGIKGVGDLDGKLQQKFVLERLARDALLQCDTVEKLHDDESLPVLLVYFVDGADIGVIQRRRGSSLALKALEGLRIRGDLRGKKLERDEAPELDVLGLVDHTHTTAAELIDDAVVRDGLIDHEIGFRGVRESYGGMGRKSKWPLGYEPRALGYAASFEPRGSNPYGFPSLTRTTSAASCSRVTASVFPSGDHANDVMVSEGKWVN